MTICCMTRKERPGLSFAHRTGRALLRLRAMINNLQDILPTTRQPALEGELELLNRTLESLYPFPKDLALARQPDFQGLGGAGR